MLKPQSPPAIAVTLAKNRPSRLRAWLRRFAGSEAGAATVEWVAWSVTVVLLVAGVLGSFPAVLTRGVNSIF